MSATFIQSSVPAGIEIHQGYEPGLIGRVSELHGRYYAKEWGAGAAFEVLMTHDICAFIESYDAQKDLILSAHIGGTLVGAIAILGQHPEPEGVQLRFFLVDPVYHGRGAGKTLLQAALDWCKKRGYIKVFLWTVDHLPQSRGLYESVGFRVTERHYDDRYTVPRDNLKMELVLNT